MSGQQNKNLTLTFSPGCMLFGMVVGLVLWLVLHPGNQAPTRCSMCHAPIDSSCTHLTIRTRTGRITGICSKCLETIQRALEDTEVNANNQGGEQ